MSHYAIAKVQITNPDKETFLQALQNIAKRLGGRVAENVIVRGWNFSKQCDYAILVNLPYGNGYGIEITGDGIKIHVDDHGAPLKAEQFAEELVKEYTSIAIEQTLREMGYSVDKSREEDKIVIYATEGW